MNWARFVASSWGRRPHLRPRVGPIASPAEVFAAVVAAAAADDPRTTMRLHAGGRERRERELLPRAADHDFAGWRARVARATGATQIALIAHPLQHHSYALWRTAGGFLAGLFAHTGIPPYGVELGAFIGDYEATPFGVHVDEVDVVMSVIEGRKRLLAWHPDELTRAEAATYRPGRRAGIAARAEVLDVRSGDLAYWPAGLWHVAETRGFTVSLHIALGAIGRLPSDRQPRGTAADLASAAVHALVAATSNPKVALPLPSDRRAELAPALRSALRPVAAHSGKLERQLLVAQLTRMTALGFVPGPPPAPAPALSSRSRLCRDPAVPIARGVVADWIVVSASGRAWAMPSHPALVRMLAAVGDTRSVADLVAPFPARGTVTRAHATRLLAELCSARALIPVFPPGSCREKKRKPHEEEQAVSQDIEEADPGPQAHRRTAPAARPRRRLALHR